MDSPRRDPMSREPGSEIDLTVVLPVYNEAGGAEPVLREILTVLESLTCRTELVVVDDGSSDGTSEILSEFSSRARILRHPENRGYGAAIKSGTTQAGGKWVCIVDADGTYPIERLSDLWSRCNTDVDMVIGARTLSSAKIPLIRRPAKWMLRRLASLLTGHSIPDLNSGFRVYRKSKAESYLPLLPNAFSFTTTITIAFLSDGLNVVYVPISYHARSGESKIRPIHDTYQFLLLILRTSVFFTPLRFFSPLGFGFMAIGAGLVVYRALIGAAFGVTSILLFVTGLQLLSIGLLADLVNRRLATVSRD